MNDNQQNITEEIKYHDLFPTPVLSTMIPESFSKSMDNLFSLELMGKEDGIEEEAYGKRTINSYILHLPEFKELSDYILKCAVDFGKNYGLPYNDFKFSQSWLSVKTPGQSHTIHTHPNSLISGVFYFGPSNQKTSAIHFHPFLSPGNGPSINMNQQINTSKYCSSHIGFDFIPGQLLLFPSSLQHSVPVNDTDLPRYSLAFNIVPTYGLGEEASLTELKF
tara:strand:- start:1078 stop:1740 length:663 start_codon:yes stop_codon:yes gene_type:complete